jgi:N-hydroxyarylamine O-acetyltransferase
MNRYRQASPESMWTQTLLCTIATPKGRITLRDSQFISISDGIKVSRPVESVEDCFCLLKEQFGIELPQGVQLPLELILN